MIGNNKVYADDTEYPSTPDEWSQFLCDQERLGREHAGLTDEQIRRYENKLLLHLYHEGVMMSTEERAKLKLEVQKPPIDIDAIVKFMRADIAAAQEVGW